MVLWVKWQASGEDAVQDLTAVGHVAGDRNTVSRFLKDNRTPNVTLCKIFRSVF